MAQELLKRTKVSSVFHHQRGSGVAQKMTGAAILNPNGVQVTLDVIGQEVAMQATPILGDEQAFGR